MPHPQIIQGGMGIAVSNWRLAREVSMLGELGVVSGTGITSVLVRRLQDGDPTGDVVRALRQFPDQAIVETILADYFLPKGKDPLRPYKRAPMYTISSTLKLQQLTVVANFVEVYLAKEGHQGLVGINLLEKIQMPNLASLYGAMLADVDYVLMGAGIPREIPLALDRMVEGLEASIKLLVEGAVSGEDHRVVFDPAKVIPSCAGKKLKRPNFFPIVSSVILATNLLKKATGRIDGFVVENKTAGGHNAPPRGPQKLSESGEPVYGPKDEINYEGFKDLGVPYWIAGSFASPAKLAEAKSLGATGIQAGTVFAFSQESGMSHTLKKEVLNRLKTGTQVRVFTDPLASPSGFPFKVADSEGTCSDEAVANARPRKCDLGYLRNAYRKEDGALGYRCAAEPVADYLKKGGQEEETVGRKCLCNGLMATIGLGQLQESGYEEKPIITSGDELSALIPLLRADDSVYSARDVVRYLRSEGV